MKKSIYQQLMLFAILLIITKDANSACSTGKWCSGSTFSPPPVFYTVEGAIAISNKGYVRGSYSTSNMYAYPAACSSSSSSNNNQFSNLNTKFQQVGDSTDPINNSDWFYIPYGDFNANKCTASFTLKQQLLIQGSYEGCIAELYFYYNSGWYVDRRLHTVGYTIDSTTGAQKIMFYTIAEKSFSLGTDTNIPCFKRDLYYHPYKRFFFYYYDNTKIVAIDRGFGSSTGDACTNAQTPSSINFYTIAVSSMNSILKPVYYGGFAYIPMWHSSNGFSYIYRWDVNVDSTGLITSSAFVNILTSPSTKKFDSVAGMRDVGIFFIYNGQVGYYLQKINSADGTASGSILTQDSTYSWKLFQANYNVETDLRPVYASPSNTPNKYYKATNVLNLDFTDSANKYDFFTYPVSFGKYYAMELRPGTCAQENGGSEDYNYLHVNVLSLRDKAHVTCIDDSIDIYCGNGKWEAYNCEACDDNNVSNSDGCSSACQVETRWVCTSVVNATSVCTYTACGNSYLDSGETCDDGNTASSDGCSSTCQIENCYMCTGVGAGSCTLACKNGAIGTVRYNGVSSTEVCDEGVGADALGCLNCCTTIQTGYKCGAAGTECYLRCGDGVLDTGSDVWGNTPEKCDDGNRVSGDGCQADCGLIEAGYECPTPGTLCNKICGNGKYENPFTTNSTCGVYSNEDCDYTKAGNNLQNTFKDPYSVCCTNCAYDYSRSIRKQLGLEFSYNDEKTFISQSGTYKARNVAGQYSGTEIEYCVPVCKSSYTTGKEFSDTWLSSFNSNYKMYFDHITSGTSSGNVDLTKYNKIVSNYFIDPTTRVCFQGKYCYDCLLPKFPGYAVSTAPDTDTTIIKSSRGKLRLIEYSETAYGFSYVTNQKSQIQFSSSIASVTLAHVTQGNTRQSWGNFYVQNNGVSLHDIYALHDIGGTLKFEKIYSTTDSIKAHLGYDRAIWWPTKNIFLVRQYDKITWDGYGLNSLSVQVSKAPTSYLPNQQFEPFSTGPIKIDGDLPFDAVFANDMMFLYRENTKDGNKYVTIYSWTPGHFRVEYETQVTNANTATSFVSFGQDNGALLWWNTQKTGILYKPDGTTATITVSITDSTKSTLWGSTASPDFRLIQTRSSPLNSNQAPAVYGYFEKNVLFTVTLSGTSIVLNPVVTLDTRFNLYQPIDIGQTYLANMVVHPCSLPTTNTDIYNDACVMLYKLGSASTVVCITLDTTETTFN